jgi:hypothetical protein
MNILKYVLMAGVALVALYGWGLISVVRGVRQRDKKVAMELEGLAREVEAQSETARSTVEQLARKPQLRFALYALLKRSGRLDLFPNDFLSPQAQGEAKLANWLMHPHEMRDAPKEIELVEEMNRCVEGEECTFFVYHFRMAEKHWAGEDWMLGLSGPFRKMDPPYEGQAGAFSRFGDKEGVTTPAELVDWFIGAAGATQAKAA